MVPFVGQGPSRFNHSIWAQLIHKLELTNSVSIKEDSIASAVQKEKKYFFFQQQKNQLRHAQLALLIKICPTPAPASYSAPVPDFTPAPAPALVPPFPVQ